MCNGIIIYNSLVPWRHDIGEEQLLCDRSDRPRTAFRSIVEAISIMIM
jgi:hypothetical protein